VFVCRFAQSHTLGLALTATFLTASALKSARPQKLKNQTTINLPHILPEQPSVNHVINPCVISPLTFKNQTSMLLSLFFFKENLQYAISY
jgi:hypothetical protein